jgi:predicted acetyltransferase
MIENIQLRHRLTAGRLPTSVYDLFVDGQDVGFIQIRHRPSHGSYVAPEFATNIAYAIHIPFRRRGYGTMILKLGLLEARKLGLREVLIGSEVENVASVKIIERNGGVLLKAFQDHGGSESNHYRIDLR